MRKVTLAGTSLRTSQLGFGCTGLMGLPTERDRLDLLAAAFDGGVRHFDTARYYGFGEAEHVLGRFLRGRRGDVTVTTKFGIRPPEGIARMSAVLHLARRVARWSAGLRAVIARQARRLVVTGAFRVSEARTSLDNSLRALATDYVDLLLLHEPSLLDSRSDGLKEFLDGAVRQGKVRHVGVGAAFSRVLDIVHGNPDLARVVQFDNSLLVDNLERLPRASERAVITHRALADTYRRVTHFLASQPHAARRWSDALGEDCGQPSVIADLLLRYAIRRNADGIVLFSTRSVRHLEDNLNTVVQPPLGDEEIATLAGLAREIPTAGEAVIRQ